MSHSSDLTAKQHQAIAALLSSHTVVAAAHKAGVNPKTIHRWLALPVFQAALRAEEEQLINHATLRLVRAQEMAISVLSVTMGGKIAPDAVRLRAAQITLEHLVKLRLLRDVETRLAALERGSK